MKRLLLFVTLITALPSAAQQTISLEECYGLVHQNYPLAKQSQLLATQNELDSEVISTAKLPQFSLDAQATYQSDVIEVPIPNANITPLNKDQYRATFSVNQLLYNGGATDAALRLKSAEFSAKQKQVDVNLYQLKQHINKVYFSVLMTQETTALLAAKQTQLKAKLSEVQSGITYGVILPSSDKILEAELLKLQQQAQEVESNKTSLIETLGSIIGKPLAVSTNFENPYIETPIQTEINRPELQLFLLKKETIARNQELLAKQNTPKLFGFATGGYGNPGLNMLDNSFQTFYIAGVKLNWNVFDWNANKKQREALAIHKDIVTTEAETFTLNTAIALDQQQKEIEKIQGFITSDMAIVDLRKEVLATAASQLKNGVITSSAYVTELTNLFEDENTLARHKIQLQLAKVNYNNIQGK